MNVTRAFVHVKDDKDDFVKDLLRNQRDRFRNQRDNLPLVDNLPPVPRASRAAGGMAMEVCFSDASKPMPAPRLPRLRKGILNNNDNDNADVENDPPPAPKPAAAEAKEEKLQQKKAMRVPKPAPPPHTPRDTDAKSECVRRVEAMQAQREERRRHADEAKRRRADEERAAADAGIGVDAVDFLRLLDGARHAQGLTSPAIWQEGAHVWDGSPATSRIRVCVRKRPMLQTERLKHDFDCVRTPVSMPQPLGFCTTAALPSLRANPAVCGHPRSSAQVDVRGSSGVEGGEEGGEGGGKGGGKGGGEGGGEGGGKGGGEGGGEGGGGDGSGKGGGQRRGGRARAWQSGR